MANSRDYEVSFRLGAEMESSFARSISTASGDFKSLQDQVQQLFKGGGSADTTKPVRQDLVQTQNEFRNTESAADRLGGMLKKVAITVGGFFAARKVFDWGKDWVNTFADFENEMQRVRALSGATNEEFAKLNAQAKELNATTVFTGKQAAEGMAFLSMAGYQTNDILAAMPGLLSAAAAGQEELGVTADIVSNVLQGFGIAAADTGRVADVLTQAFTSSNVTMGMIGETMKYVAPNAKAAGISLEETAAAAGLLGNAGIQASMAGTSLRSIISRFSAPTGGAATMMKKLGIEAINADGSLKGLAEIIEEVTTATEKMGEAQTIETVKTLVGQTATASFLALMDSGADSLKNFTTELENSDGAAQNIADTMLDSFTGSMTLLNSAIESAKISLGEKLAPTIRAVADLAADRLPKIVERFDKSFQDMVNSSAWQDGDWIDRAKIAWDKLVTEPFGDWWNKEGKGYVSKIGGEFGSLLGKAVTETVKKALSFDGAGSWLSAGALAIPAIKVGGGISSTIRMFNTLGRAGGTAAGGVGQATKSVGLFGPALSMLTNPIGLTVGGIGVLTAGVIAYRKHQERMRQDLINLGSTLRNASDEYQAVADKAEVTKVLTEEYRELDHTVRNNVGTAEELAGAQARMSEITRQLQEMFPQTLSNYDIENGKMIDKLDLLNQMTEAELEYKRAQLESEIATGQARQSDLEKEIGNIEESVQKTKDRIDAITAEKDAIDAAIPVFQKLEAQWMKIMNMEYSEDRSRLLNELVDKANEAGKSVGLDFSGNIGLLEGTADLLDKKQQKVLEQRAKIHEEYLKQLEELNTAIESYEALYQAQTNLIELDLGGKLEDQAKKWDEMTEAQREQFLEAAEAMLKLNHQMDMLPTEKRIDVSVVYREIGAVDIFSKENSPVNRFTSKSAPKNIFSLDQYADGGFARTASIFGEAGLEAAIPIDNRPRSHMILDRVNQLMGHSSGGGGGDINVSFAPQITIPGGTPDIQAKVAQAVKQARDDLIRELKAIQRQEKRLKLT